MAQEDNSTMLFMADPENGSSGVEDLGNHLMNLFEQELRQKRVQCFITEPLEEGELPEVIACKYKLVLVKSYFDNQEGYTFPRIMK